MSHMMTMAAAKTASVYIAWAGIRSPPRRPNSQAGRRHKPDREGGHASMTGRVIQDGMPAPLKR